jgi:transposase-like protein
MGTKGAVRCPGCRSVHIDYQGLDDAQNQKWRCRDCGQRFTFKPAEAKPSEAKAA